jgi:hypothetical protein
VLGKKAKKAKDAAPDLKEVAGREIDKAMKEAAKGRGPATTQASSSPAPDSDAVMEVVEVVLKGGAGFTVRALDDSDDEPLLARDGKLLMFANLRDLGDFAAEGGDHTLTARQGWDAIADAARSGSLAPELLDSYDLTEVPDLADGTAEDRWTAGLLVGYAIDVADTVGCPSLEALKPDSALLTLEREPEAFEGGKHAATLREKLIQEARSVWPKVLRDIESRSVWWSVLGTSGAPTAEKAKQDEALRLAQAEAAVATLNEGLPAEPAFVIPSRTPEGKGVTTIAPQQEPAAPAYDWDAVGAFPVEIRLPRGKGVTLVAYPDDESTMFLGGRGHVLLFANQRGLLAYLRGNPEHSLADLPGWKNAPPLDVAALEPTGFYYLHDVPDRLLKGVDAEGAAEITEAFLLAADMAKQLGNEDVLAVVDASGPLARFMSALAEGGGGATVSAFGVQPSVPMPTPPEAAAMWRRMTRRLDDSVTFLN